MSAILLMILAAPPSYAATWGVVSGDGKSVYLRTDKGLEALDGATGKPLWTAEGARPVAEAGGVLVAYGAGKGGMRLVGLDVKTGKKKWDKTVPLIDGVGVSNGPGRSFSARAAEARGSLLVGYRANAWYYGGARPSPEIEKAARKEDIGTLKIDPATGELEKLAGDKLPPAPPPRNGDVIFSVEQGARVVLRRTKGGETLPAVTLSEKPAQAAVALDGKVVLVQTGGDEKRVSWKAVDPATGEGVGRFETRGGVHSMDAAAGRAFAFTDEKPRAMPFGTFARTLEVIDLKTGKAIWSRKGESVSNFPPPP